LTRLAGQDLGRRVSRKSKVSALLDAAFDERTADTPSATLHIRNMTANMATPPTARPPLTQGCR
jgi:hypothetical protein